MCGFCTEFQSNCEIDAISSTILFPLILNVFCTGYSYVVYFYVKKDYSSSIIYLSIFISLTKTFAFYLLIFPNSDFYVETWDMLACLL